MLGFVCSPDPSMLVQSQNAYITPLNLSSLKAARGTRLFLAALKEPVVIEKSAAPW